MKCRAKSPLMAALITCAVVGLAVGLRAARAQAPAANAPPAASTGSVAIPGFWDPRRRPERPDLSRVTLIRFISEVDYPPFNYSGPDDKPADNKDEHTRMICE